MSDEKFYTVSEVAELLEVSGKTVRNWIDKGKIKAFRFGLAYKITETELKNFLQKSLVNNEEKGE